LKGDHYFPKRSSPFLNTLLTIITSLLLFSNQFIFAQDTEKLDELNRKIEELNKEVEACGSDLKCLKQKLHELDKLIMEFEVIKQQIQFDSGSLTEGLINNLPKESEFPPPFDTITKLWLKHTMAASTIMKFDCNVIKKSREEILDKIEEIYKKKEGLTGPAWPLPLVHCKETNVKLKEHGTLNNPEFYYLDYNLEFTDKAVWTADYILLVGDTLIGYSDKHSYKLGLRRPHKRSSKILHFSGWIMDNSKDPPVQLPLDRYEILKQEIIDIGVQVPSYKGYTLITPANIVEDQNDKDKIGTVTNYMLVLPYQIVRFYPALKPELFVENTMLLVDLSATIDEQYSPEEIHAFFQQGKFSKSYSWGGITQVLEIGFPALGCDEQISSTKGAIILAGDCIDHGGYVIASDKSTIVNGKPVARIGDKVLCYKHGGSEIVASGKNQVTSNKKQIARIGDKTKCGATLLGGSMNTFAGDK